MFIWQAHEGAVTSLAFAPGVGLLSTGVDGNMRLWDPFVGDLQHSWRLAEAANEPAASSILRVLAEASGQYAAVGLRNEGIQFFDLATGKVAGDFPLYNVLGLASSADLASVFVVGRERAGEQRTSRRQSRVYQHAYPPGGILASSQTEARSGALAVSPDGAQVRAGGVRFHWPDGASLDPIIISPGGNQLAVSWDGDKLFGISGTRILVTGFHFGAIRQKLKGHVSSITGLTATPDGRKIWTASTDATVRQWDMDTYRCEKCYGLKIGPLGCVAVSPDGLTAAAGSALRGSIAMWDLE